MVYDPEVLEFDELVDSAQGMDCASAVYAHTAGDLSLAHDLVGDAAKPAPARAELVIRTSRQSKSAARNRKTGPPEKCQWGD